LSQEGFKLDEGLNKSLCLLEKIGQLEKQEKYRMALEVLEELDLQVLGDPELYLIKGRVLSKLGNFKEALENIDFVLNANPNYEDAYLEKADLYFNKGDYKNGLKCFSDWENKVEENVD